ncbi:hypothetical protein OB13_02350 [Pontibacter sp. HJ8]
MDTRLYLKRINYNGELTPTLEVLAHLQQAHLMHVPFENLDIHHKTKIDLGNSYDKVVKQNRGGFCYELNGLFYQLLTHLGFQVKLVSARVFDYEGFGPEFDHMAIIATIGNENYLVDVGFGEFAFHPLPIKLNTELPDPRGFFKMEKGEENYLVVKKKNPQGDFIPEYLFTEQERQVDEFLEMCHFHQTSPESHFTQKPICSLPTPEGRITLKGNTLKITTNGAVSERPLNNEDEVQQVLRDYFNVQYTSSNY